MLVDDEMMVIEDTLQMLDWEANGFIVAGALTNAATAWELYQRERPQIVIADICMPLMDGLALSERIFATGDVVQVLLLTSHESFRYAKSAIELGVSRYLLKHELNGEVLLRELRQAADRLEEESQARQLQRQQELRRMLAGEPNAAIDSGEALAAHDWLLAFSTLPEDRLPPAGNSLHFELEQMEDAGREGAVVALEEGGLAFLLPLRAGQDGRVRNADAALQQVMRFLRGNGREDEVLLYEVLRSTTGLQEQYILWRRLRDYTIFLDSDDPSPCYRMSALAERCTNAPVDQDRLWCFLDAIEQAVEKLDRVQLSRQLDELFAICMQQPWSYNTVLRLTAALDGLCARLAQQIHMGPPAPESADIPEGVRRRRLADLRAFYADQLQTLMDQKSFLATARYSRNLSAAIRYIHRYYSEDLSLDRVASAINISGIYLSQIFKKETGQTFVEYLTTHRIEVSKKLLREDNYKIYEISDKVGFNSNQYFSQVFRKITGESPQDYRDMRR